MCRMGTHFKKKNTTHNSLDLLRRLKLNLAFTF